LEAGHEEGKSFLRFWLELIFLGEKVLNSLAHNSFVLQILRGSREVVLHVLELWIALHRVGLAAASLPVAKNGCVEAFYHALTQVIYLKFVKKPLVRGVRWENFVKPEHFVVLGGRNLVALL